MSRWGMVSLLISGLSVAVMVATRYILGGWVDFLYIPLALFAVGLIVPIFTDFKTLVEFLTLRTTKHGMNMGAMILLMIVILVSVNFLSVRYEKTFDFTEEKINSLAEQTTDLLDNLEQDITVKVFYRGAEAKAQKAQIEQALELYKENSSQVRVRYFDIYVDNAEAQKYLNDIPDSKSGAMFAFVEYGPKKTRVQQPWQEEQITSAMIKATREKSKKIYFLQGHNERDLESSDAEGIASLKQELLDSSYKVDTLSLVANPAIPDDADIVAIVGPERPFLQEEVALLRDFARQGGDILLAVDPGMKHNLALLTKTFGIEFKNNYVFSPISRMLGRGLVAIGNEYSSASSITKKFPSAMTVFDLASEVIKAPGASKDALDFKELVKTTPDSFSVTSLQQSQQPKEQRPHVMGIAVKGKLPASLDSKQEGESASEGSSPSTEEFSAVIFGDSDFLTNKSIIHGLNRDLALNTVAYLAQEADLISIRPKKLKNTTLMLTRNDSLFVVVACILLPLLLLVLSGVIWFKRRHA